MPANITKIIFSLVAIATFQSCMLTSTFDKAIAEHYGKKNPFKPVNHNHALSVTTDKLPKVNGFSRSKYNRFFTIPLLIYTYSEEKITCQVNPKSYVNTILNEIDSLLNTDSIKKKFGKKSLELSVESIPTSFQHRYFNHFISLQILLGQIPASFSKNEIFNTQGSIRVIYKLKDSLDNVVKISAVNQTTREYYGKIKWSRRYKNLKNYIQDFDSNLDFTLKQVAKEIIYDLEL